jgi:hypothetical protein
MKFFFADPRKLVLGSIAIVAAGIGALLFEWPGDAAAKMTIPKTRDVLVAHLAVQKSISNNPVFAAGQTWVWPANAPLMRMLPQLELSAEKGDVHAACTLSQALMHCRRAASRKQHNYDQEELASLETGDVLGADDIVESRIHAAKSEQFCASIPEPSANKSDDLLLQAVHGGERTAMFYFVEGSFIDFSQPAFLGQPAFLSWQNEAETVANKMLANGWPEALRILAPAYRDSQSSFAALVRDDPYKARVLDLLKARLFNDIAETEPLSTAHEAKARQEAETLWIKNFEGAQYALDEHMGPVTAEHWQPEQACE